jgi:hypothetical protein
VGRSAELADDGVADSEVYWPNGRLTTSNMDSACVPVPLDGIAGDLALGCAVDRCDTMLVDGPVGCKAG